MTDQNQPVVQKTPLSKSKPKAPMPFQWFRIFFIILGGLLLLLISVIEWQRGRYSLYSTQRSELVTVNSGETSVTQLQVKQLDGGFLSENDIVSFLETISQAKNTFSDFKLQFVSDVPEGKKQPKYLPVIITLSGSYKNVELFLHTLFNSPYVIRVQAIDLVSDDGFGNETTLTLNADVYVSESFSGQ